MANNNLVSQKKYFFIDIILAFLILSSYKNVAASPEQPEISFLYGAGSSASIKKILEKKKIIPPVSSLVGVEYRSPSAKRFPIKLDIQVLKHFVHQKSFEIVVCPVIFTPGASLGKVGFNWAIGNGVSALVGKSTDFEEVQGVKTRKVLNYLLIEQNMFLKEKPNWQLSLRWHHRCHIFGTIAPKTTGSNFFVIGIKYLI